MEEFNIRTRKEIRQEQNQFKRLVRNLRLNKDNEKPDPKAEFFKAWEEKRDEKQTHG